MKKNILTLILIALLAACGGRATPVAEPTSTPAPTSTPTIVIPSATADVIVSTVTPIEATSELAPNLRTSPIDGMPQVFIPAGTFHMGGMDVRSAPDELPAHEVTLDAFWMDQLEVTNAMYQLCIQAGSCTPPQNFKSSRRTEYFNNSEFKDYPVVYVTWGQAKSYCEWAGRHLPSEAEWERAARGDDWRTFPWGEDKADGLRANYNMIVGDTSRVGTYPLGASPFGVLDLAGNVAEWTNDYYSATYYVMTGEALNPTGPETSASLRRVVRGGSLGDAEINIRVPKRSSVLGSNPELHPASSAYLGDFSPRIGFRCIEAE
ncbi:MAG TPA: SUMF1/EgtB/PvdO family nonheme iron enzyme [Anaerolineales bacterium]|nr:SUMF1/EgtB/PvdO family nonheme iron enzyme [Anaerolineales bacterium]